ncbi:hypothetical protein SCHPADRAFT_52917 [Schizopora paradoxa]|uniref:Uncharacterized protein n=1 Tax=Schizopora paradoxa TaxID=27342 RepID=A0A0H2S622_9AGAM|nr:hypothetical protein SCHPADRAFT_52917 [Schizopora paradoxa]
MDLLTEFALRFFKNTAAVAGVFTVVGLIALVLIIALGTNAIRRRRAKRFDADVAAAAAEAAAISNYPFDEEDGRGGGYGYKSTYSDPESNGTLSQSPMSHGENYNMTEYPGYAQPATYNAAPTRGYGDYQAGAGIAGFGASEAVTRDHVGGRAPYGAFATPGGPAPGDVFASGGPYPMQGRELADAAGIGAAGAAGVGATYLNRGPSQNAGTMLTRGPSNSASRSLSSDNASGGRGPGSSGHESYAAHYQPNFQPEQHQYVPQPAHNQYAAGGAAASDGRLAPPVEEEALTNPFSPSASTKGFDVDENEEAYGADSYEPVTRPELHPDESRLSIRDEDDYGRAGRTLKIANV